MTHLKRAVCLFSLCELCAAVPMGGLDLPRELIMDVNKPPYPTVNIIVDQPSGAVEDARALKSARQFEQMRARESAKGSASQIDVANHALRVQSELSTRISALRSVYSS